MLGLGRTLLSDSSSAFSGDFSAIFNFDSNTEGFHSVGSSGLTVIKSTFSNRSVLQLTDSSTTGTAFITGVMLNTSPTTSQLWSGAQNTNIYGRIIFYIPSTNSSIVSLERIGFSGQYFQNSNLTGTDQWLSLDFTTNTGIISQNYFLIFFKTNDQVGTGDIVYIDSVEISTKPIN